MPTVSAIATVTYTGASRRQYKFDVHLIGTPLPAGPGVYIVTNRVRKPSGEGSHTEIYVGQASDVPGRFDSHHKVACFERHGANCVCIHRDGDERSRLAKEADLLAALKPVCNG